MMNTQPSDMNEIIIERSKRRRKLALLAGVAYLGFMVGVVIWG